MVRHWLKLKIDWASRSLYKQWHILMERLSWRVRLSDEVCRTVRRGFVWL